MKINETTINCCKPKRFTTFTGAESSKSRERRITGKHFHQMSDNDLQLRSVLKAQSEVQNGGKMRMFKAIPAITTGLISTTIAITQPGKLAAKAGAGLGFLMLNEVMSNHCNNKYANEQKEPTLKDTLVDIAKFTAAIGVGVLALKGFKTTKAGKFVQKEAQLLAKEINSTKLGKFVDETVNPFIKKHATKFNLLGTLGPIATVLGSGLVQIGLIKDMSNEVKERAEFNYLKGKLIQEHARVHYESINAPEVE